MSKVSHESGRAGLVVSIDGPVASGKSSVGNAAAMQLGLRFLDTGIMYRAATWLAHQTGTDAHDEAAMGELMATCRMTVGGNGDVSSAITLNGFVLTADELTAPEIDRDVSAVAAGSALRRVLVALQRAIASDGSIVMAGRDIGSVVLPDADVKIYIDASAEERARRRLRQQANGDEAAAYQRSLEDTIRRDRLDSERSDSPLTIPDGAVVINTDGLDFDQTVSAVVSRIRAAVGDPASATVTSG